MLKLFICLFNVTTSNSRLLFLGLLQRGLFPITLTKQLSNCSILLFVTFFFHLTCSFGCISHSWTLSLKHFLLLAFEIPIFPDFYLTFVSTPFHCPLLRLPPIFKLQILEWLGYELLSVFYLNTLPSFIFSVLALNIIHNMIIIKFTLQHCKVQILTWNHLVRISA